MFDAAAMPAPWFFTVSETVRFAPSRKTLEVTTWNFVKNKSGPMTIERLRVLLVSLVSETAFPSSAFAMMKNVPDAVPAGMVTVVEPVLDAPAANGGTATPVQQAHLPLPPVYLVDR